MIYALIVSVILNVLLVYYSRKVAQRLIVVGTNLSILRETAESFNSAASILHESEMYYGDTSLQVLIDQSKDLMLAIDEHADVYTLVIDEEEDIINDRNYEIEEEATTAD